MGSVRRPLSRFEDYTYDVATTPDVLLRKTIGLKHSIPSGDQSSEM